MGVSESYPDGCRVRALTTCAECGIESDCNAHRKGCRLSPGYQGDAQLVQCKACQGTGRNPSVFHGFYGHAEACDGCHGAGVHRL